MRFIKFQYLDEPTRIIISLAFLRGNLSYRNLKDSFVINIEIQ